MHMSTAKVTDQRHGQNTIAMAMVPKVLAYPRTKGPNMRLKNVIANSE